MNQNVPKRMFLGHFRLESVGTLTFYFSKKHMLYFLYIRNIYFRPIQGPDGVPMEGPPRAQMERPWRAHPGPRWSAHGGPTQGPGWSAHAGPRAQGPWRPKADQLEAEGRPNGGLGAKPPEKKHIEKNQGGPHHVSAG